MGQEQTSRRLAAIMAADVAGYSRMMGADEAGTLNALKHHRADLFEPAVAAHRGRVVKLIGDGTLVEFASVVDAVNCGLAIQRAVRAQTALGGQPIVLRIGINLGDIIIDGDDIYGDGVNIAARLEGLAAPGGICLSGIVNESLGSRVEAAFRYGGEVTVKNIDRPIKVWKWHPDSDDPTVGRRQEAGEPARPAAAQASIAVLPFDNMSGDAEQEYFSDGISEDIITDLSKVSALTIIGRNTAFSFKGKPVDMHTLNRDLGTTHVLEGSVRKAGTRVRINAQLTDCLTGHQLWADRYDRDLDDIFAIQDEISKAIVAALRLQLLPKEKKAIERRGTTNPDAYSVYLLARQHWINGNYGDRRRDEMVVRICKQATAIDPGYADAWALMALAQAELRFLHGLDEDGLPAAERALAIDPEVPVALCVKARYLMQDGKLEEAQRQLEEALRLDPDSFEVNKELAYLTFRQDRVKDAIPFFEKAVSLMESDYRCAGMLTTCYQSFGTPEDMQRVAKLAITRAERAVAQDPTNGTAMALGACALGILGEGDRMREWVARTMLLDPDNVTARYNLTCALARFGDIDGAIGLIGPFFERAGQMVLSHSDVDPDLNLLRADPRFQAMRAAAGARLGLAENAKAATAAGPSNASVA